MEGMSIVDKLQQVDDRFWISKPFVLKSYFEEMMTKCVEVKGSVTTDFSESQKVAALMDVSIEDIKQMENEVNPSFLTIDDEVPPIRRSTALALHGNYRSTLLPTEASDIPDEARATLRSLQQRIPESLAVKNKLKYERYGLQCLVNDPSVSSGDQLKKNDVILVVRIYKPTDKGYAADKTKWFFPRCDQQFMVHGRQLLTELRDKIACPKDKEPIGTQGLPEALRHIQLSDDAAEGELGVLLTAGDKFKSSYFFIENVFYVDSRDESMHDLSEPIRRKAESLGDWTVKKAAMQRTKFIDLTVRLGRPYLFLHQGNCEHLMVFSDGRLVHEDDQQNESAYPHLTHVSSAKPFLCMVCKKMCAKWVTCNNMNVTEDPFYFCEDCYRSFNFDREGNKKGSFEAFPFVDRNEVL